MEIVAAAGEEEGGAVELEGPLFEKKRLLVGEVRWDEVFACTCEGFCMCVCMPGQERGGGGGKCYL